MDILITTQKQQQQFYTQYDKSNNTLKQDINNFSAEL